MNALWQLRLHRCARLLGWAGGLAVVALAMLVLLAQLLLPLLARHPAWVAAQISQQLQRPVSVASMESHRTLVGPVFVLNDVRVGAAAGESGAELRIPQARLTFNFGGWLLPSRHLVNLHVRGLQLDLQHDADGGWHVNGIGLTGGTDQQPLSLGHFSIELWLEDLRVQIADARSGQRYALLATPLRLSRQGSQIRVGATLRRAGLPAALSAAGRFREDGQQGRLWLGVGQGQLKPLLEGIDLGGYVIAQGQGQLEAWLDWREGRLTQALLRTDMDDLAVSAPGGSTARVAHVHGLAGWRQREGGYDVRWGGDEGGALALSLHHPGEPLASVGFAARDLQLEPLLPWLALQPDMAPAVAQWLGGGYPRGELSEAALRWNRADGLQTVALTFQNLAIEAVDKLPGISGLRGTLRGDAQGLSLELPTQSLTLALPHLFEQPLALSTLGGTLAFWPQEGDWHAGIDTLDFAGAGYTGQIRGEASLPAKGGPPFMDVYVGLGSSDLLAVKGLLPWKVMAASAMEWVDHSLLGGRVGQAQILLRGDLADWPFRHNEGRFEARAEIHDLSLDYGTGWPRADGIDAVANFIDNGMLVTVSAGHSLGVDVDGATAAIADFDDSVLTLAVQGHGKGGSVMSFVRNSPIGHHQADTLGKLDLGGSATFGFQMTLPLKHADDLQLSGAAQLQDADLSAPAWNLKFDRLGGPLSFDAHGLKGELRGGFRGQPSVLNLAVARANPDPDTILSAELRGSYRFSELLQGFHSLDWLAELADGRSDFTVGFKLAHVPGSDAISQQLSVDSPLTGTRLKFPAPLDKPATETLPLRLTMSLPVENSDLQLALGDVMRGHLRLPADDKHALAGVLAFGSQISNPLPAQGLRIRGHAARLDVTGWVQQIVGGSSGGGGAGLESVDVGTDQSQWFGSQLGALTIRATTEPASLSVDVDGAAMAGNFSVPTQDLNRRGVTARLHHLYWPNEPTPPAKPAAEANPNPAVIAENAEPPVNPARTGINPAALPPFHLWVSDLRLGDGKLGEARLETWPTAEGLHIEQLRALSRHVQINASGDWNGDAEDSHTQMKISFAAEDLGAMLGAFGYDGLVNGGKTSDELDARWPGPPSALSLANMTGTLSVQVNNGRIPEAASPGVGRLLGLVSLTELPRRLTLDFGDVFGKGLAFDSITGDFHLADGNATTGNLVIAGPSANISISGRTGLRARDYDQQVRVVPHVGNSLPLVGAVVGGPIGAAAGFAVQGLLGKGLNQAASARYKVTGSWDKPVMTLIEKQGVEPVAPAINAPLLPTPAPASAGSTASPLLPVPASVPAPASSSGH